MAGSSLLYLHNSTDSAMEPSILPRFYCSSSRSEQVLNPQTILDLPPVPYSPRAFEGSPAGWQRFSPVLPGFNPFVNKPLDRPPFPQAPPGYLPLIFIAFSVNVLFLFQELSTFIPVCQEVQDPLSSLSFTKNVRHTGVCIRKLLPLTAVQQNFLPSKCICTILSAA